MSKKITRKVHATLGYKKVLQDYHRLIGKPPLPLELVAAGAADDYSARSGSVIIAGYERLRTYLWGRRSWCLRRGRRRWGATTGGGRRSSARCQAWTTGRAGRRGGARRRGRCGVNGTGLYECNVVCRRDMWLIEMQPWELIPTFANPVLKS